jgi:hypothetical protein
MNSGRMKEDFVLCYLNKAMHTVCIKVIVRKRHVMSILHVFALLVIFSFIISHYYIFSMSMTSARIWCPCGTVKNCIHLNRFGEALQNALIA